jgi:two-component system, NtrC family, response regulator AtoC
MKTILCIDDDLRHGEMVKASLPGYRVLLAGTGVEGSQQWLRTSPDLVLLDLLLPDIHGLELLDRFGEGRENPSPILVITGMGDPHVEKEAMARGAEKVLKKPVSRNVLRRVITGMVRKKNPAAQDGQAAQAGQDGADIRTIQGTAIVGESEALLRVKELAETYALSDYQVLITGESGTGKELFARHIHKLSKRGDKPLSAINCASIPDSLAESELFGSERGAYTGAISKPGLFERANGGTLFLDEIGELSPVIQAKLLRVIETGTVCRLGGERERVFDVRYISATNRDLQQMVRERTFREDLYYRLSCLDLDLPPLRERPEDIMPIVSMVLEEGYSITEPALGRLCQLPWPGNVRELINALKKVMLFSGKERIITREQLLLLEKGKTYRDRIGTIEIPGPKQLSLF